MKKTLIILFVSIALSNCTSSSKKPQIDLLKELDLTTIDNYPAFDSCADEIDKKSCFYKELTITVQEQLDTIILDDTLGVDSFFIYVKIDTKGNFTIEKIENKIRLTKEFILELKEKINEIPSISPALKQGIPTNSTYKIRINLKNATA